MYSFLPSLDTMKVFYSSNGQYVQDFMPWLTDKSQHDGDYLKYTTANGYEYGKNALAVGSTFDQLQKAYAKGYATDELPTVTMTGADLTVTFTKPQNLVLPDGSAYVMDTFTATIANPQEHHLYGLFLKPDGTKVFEELTKLHQEVFENKADIILAHVFYDTPASIVRWVLPSNIGLATGIKDLLDGQGISQRNIIPYLIPKYIAIKGGAIIEGGVEKTAWASTSITIVFSDSNGKLQISGMLWPIREFKRYETSGGTLQDMTIDAAHYIIFPIYYFRDFDIRGPALILLRGQAELTDSSTSAVLHAMQQMHIPASVRNKGALIGVLVVRGDAASLGPGDSMSIKLVIEKGSSLAAVTAPGSASLPSATSSIFQAGQSGALSAIPRIDLPQGTSQFIIKSRDQFVLSSKYEPIYTWSNDDTEDDAGNNITSTAFGIVKTGKVLAETSTSDYTYSWNAVLKKDLLETIKDNPETKTIHNVPLDGYDIIVGQNSLSLNTKGDFTSVKVQKAHNKPLEDMSSQGDADIKRRGIDFKLSANFVAGKPPTVTFQVPCTHVYGINNAPKALSHTVTRDGRVQYYFVPACVPLTPARSQQSQGMQLYAPRYISQAVDGVHVTKLSGLSESVYKSMSRAALVESAPMRVDFVFSNNVTGDTLAILGVLGHFQEYKIGSFIQGVQQEIAANIDASYILTSRVFKGRVLYYIPSAIGTHSKLLSDTTDSLSVKISVSGLAGDDYTSSHPSQQGSGRLYTTPGIIAEYSMSDGSGNIRAVCMWSIKQASDRIAEIRKAGNISYMQGFIPEVS